MVQDIAVCVCVLESVCVILSGAGYQNANYVLQRLNFELFGIWLGNNLTTLVRHRI